MCVEVEGAHVRVTQPHITRLPDRPPVSDRLRNSAADSETLIGGLNDRFHTGVDAGADERRRQVHVRLLMTMDATAGGLGPAPT